MINNLNEAGHGLYTCFDLVVKVVFASFIYIIWKRLPGEHNKALEGMYDALNIKSPYYYNHSKRVALICEAICSHLAISKKEKEELMSAAYLHDIGKMFLDEEVLHCNRALNDAEWKTVKLHPLKGSLMAEKFHTSTVICNLILSHHENLDGTGYPLNLSGEEISLPARILRIADSIDAMAMPRPYREAMSFEAIAKELNDKSGIWYDANIVKSITNGLSKRIRLIILNNY